MICIALLYLFILPILVTSSDSALQALFSATLQHVPCPFLLVS